MTMDEIRAWKADQEQKGFYPMSQVQPKYESVVRLGSMRYGLSVRRADGTRAIQELGGGRHH
jgi:hypothetical protein